jgi:hypothetical protein
VPIDLASLSLLPQLEKSFRLQEFAEFPDGCMTPLKERRSKNISIATMSI